jgi:hypothetical protein
MGKTNRKLAFFSPIGLAMAKNQLLALLLNPPKRNMTHKKPFLPQKKCATCGKPFSWRKKWEKVWEEVKYCSDRCRKGRTSTPTKAAPW